MIGGVLSTSISSSRLLFSSISNKAFQHLLSQSKVCLCIDVRFVYPSQRLNRNVLDRFLTLTDSHRFGCELLRISLPTPTTWTKMSRHFSVGEGAYQVPMDLFELNRKRLCEKLKLLPDIPEKSVVVLQGGQPINRYCTDVEYVFRQESFFHWAFGVIEADFYGAIEVDTGLSHLFIPKYPEAYAVWMGKIFSCDHYKQKYGVGQVHYVDEMATVLGDAGANLLLTIKGMNTDSNLWTREAVFDGMSKFKLDSQLLYPVIVECCRTLCSRRR